MHNQGTLAAAVGAVLLTGTGAFAQVLVEYQPAKTYRSFTDSPWATESVWEYFHLQDFESGSSDLVGASAIGGAARAPSMYTDSVDGDDGVFDFLGNDGWSFLSFGDMIRFEFDEVALGGLPSAAGLVWTDGNPAALFDLQYFDADGELIGSFVSALGDGSGMGEADEDRFVGIEYSDGISAIQLTTTLGKIEVDHLQYGLTVVPAAPALGALAVAGLLGRRRRRV